MVDKSQINCCHLLDIYLVPGQLQPAYYSAVVSSNLVYIDKLVHEKRDSIVNALELRLSCTNPWYQGISK